jgi:hypothetical protein
MIGPIDRPEGEELAPMQDIAVAIPWYRTLSRAQWRVLAASNLG